MTKATHILFLAVLVLMLFTAMQTTFAEVVQTSTYQTTTYTDTTGSGNSDSYQNLIDKGYTCVYQSTSESYLTVSERYLCYKISITYGATTYTATQRDYRTLVGTSNTLATRKTFYKLGYLTYTAASTGDGGGAADADSPFIYFKNPPEGDITVSLTSPRDTYYPKPDFNREKGWVLDAQNGKVSLEGVEKDSLFYELEVDKIKLNRNGRNFTSKEELANFLQDSDFLHKLNFSQEETKNSLEYFLPKLSEVEDTEYYYLTVLSDNAVSEVSQLSITPTPEAIERVYFAVYPTTVPVKTTGDLMFQESFENQNNFVVKETGEILITKNMPVFFENN